jgi:hypothetical protein
MKEGTLHNSRLRNTVGQVTVLPDKYEDQDKRDWDASAAAEYGWSRNVRALAKAPEHRHASLARGCGVSTARTTRL